MKKLLYLLLTLSVALSCRNNDKGQSLSRNEKRIEKQTVAAAEDYARGELKNASRAVTDAGIIVLSDSLSRILIDPSRIVTGDFEGDSLPDAIIPLYLFREQNQNMTIHLFLINNEGKLMTVRALEDDMNVLSVMKRVIYIELPVKSSDDKNPGSVGEKEVKEFIFVGDSLRRYFSSTDTIR